MIVVAIPTLNAAATIQATLSSLVALKGAGSRIIAADSHSVDGTRDLLRGVAHRIIDVEPGNMYSAVNAALRAEDWQWGTYLNGDDLLYGCGLLEAVKTAPNEAEMIYGDIDFIDWNGRFLHSWRSPDVGWLGHLFAAGINPVPQQGTVFRRELFDRLGGFDERFRFSADFDFFLRAYVGGAQVRRYRGAPLAGFRLHAKQLSQGHRQQMVLESQCSFARCGLRSNRIQRYWAFWRMRLRNLDQYVVRILRHRQLRGVSTIPKSMSH